FARRAEDADERARHQRRVDLLIPVAKAWSTELSVHSSSLGVQVHGGMGYIEETGAAQHLRDARITTIYEGTTGIQSLDLVGRKIARDQGKAVGELVADMRATAVALGAMSSPDVQWQALSATVLAAAILVDETKVWILAQNGNEPSAVAVNVLELFGIALGAWAMGDAALKAGQRIAAGNGREFHRSKLRLVQFYMDNVFPQALALEKQITHGASSTLSLSARDFGAVA
uniref:acyl-CoA dehydrogenase C-terminal domain-containing protein n=1 Tax=Actibacterium sp. TaxID=1872125 RepID=UPI00356304C0